MTEVAAEHLVTFHVRGRPATFATAHEKAWKEAVRAAIATTGVRPRPDARFSVRMVFRTAASRTANDRWDTSSRNIEKGSLRASGSSRFLRHAWPATELVPSVRQRFA